MRNKLLVSFLLATWAFLSAAYAQKPAFSVVEKVTIDQLTHRMDHPSDTLFLYNFWATWCRPCVAELPHFQSVDTTYNQNSTPVKVVFVSIDFPDQEKNLKAFVARKQFLQPVWWLLAGDPNEWIPRIHPDWSGTIPATVAIMPRTGEKRLFETDFTLQSLIQTVDSLLVSSSQP